MPTCVDFPNIEGKVTVPSGRFLTSTYGMSCMCAPLSMAGGFIPVDADINLFIGCCSGSRIVWLLDCPRFGPRLLYMRQDSWCVAHVHVGHRARWYADLGHPVDVVLVVVAGLADVSSLGLSP
jgi:hypothetical protein